MNLPRPFPSVHILLILCTLLAAVPTGAQTVRARGGHRVRAAPSAVVQLLEPGGRRVAAVLADAAGAIA